MKTIWDAQMSNLKPQGPLTLGVIRTLPLRPGPWNDDLYHGPEEGVWRIGPNGWECITPPTATPLPARALAPPAVDPGLRTKR